MAFRDLPERRLVSFNDKSPDKAYRFMESFCGQHAFQVPTPDSFHFSYSGSATGEGSTSFGCLKYNSAVSIQLDNDYENYSLSLPLLGSQTVMTYGRQIRFSNGRSFILSPGQEKSVELSEDCKFLLVTFHRRTVEAELRRLLGRNVGRLPVFSLEMVDSSGLSASWWRGIKTYLKELAQKNSIIALPGMSVEFERSLVRSLLLLQDNDMKNDIVQAISAALPSSIVRVKTFIEQNYATPLSLLDLQRSSGLSSARLGLEFKEHLGCSPMRYLKKIRLEHARELLLSRGSSRKISTIVFDVGLSHFGRFSVEYKAAFGESPKETAARTMARNSLS